MSRTRIREAATMDGIHNKDNAKNGRKQVPLRISAQLYAELERWAEDDFRSLNGQIEYLLTECVRRRRGVHASPSDGGDRLGSD